MSEDHKFITIVPVGAGASWAKGSTPEDTVERVGRIIKEDWSGLYQVAGETFEAGVWELAKLPDDWHLDSRGMFSESLGEWIKPDHMMNGTIPK